MSDDHRQSPPSDLEHWERWILALLGLGLNVIGGISIFVTSNQVATATLFLVGTVLLLIGIQGTPLLKASTQDIELTARKVAEKAEQRMDSGHTDDAYEVLDDAVQLTPGLTRDPVFRALTATAFEKAALARLTHVVADRPNTEVHLGATVVGTLGPALNRWPDAEVRFHDPDIRLAIEVKYLSQRGQLISWAVGTAQQHFDDYAGVLFIVNSDAIAREEAYLTDERIQIVSWRGREDDIRLRDAIDTLYRVAISREGH